jgi:uncharacterized membrane protein
MVGWDCVAGMVTHQITGIHSKSVTLNTIVMNFIHSYMFQL